MKNKLIQLYLLICHIYDNHSDLCFQRLSNNSEPKFTDQELITIYFFGHLHGFHQKKQIHFLIKTYWSDWFPDLPSYQAFSRRLNLLESSFQAIGHYLFDKLSNNRSELDHLIDSFPIMLAAGTRSKKAKVARDVADVGFCATKQTNFHGVRLHCLCRKRTGKLPTPYLIWLRSGSVHDLTALKEQEIHLPNTSLFADKAYADKQLRSTLKQSHCHLLTPLKKPKGKELSRSEKHYSHLVSRIRQPIESFFKWHNDKTKIQTASQVRSTDGLLTHCFGKLAFALFLYVFYY